MDINDIEGSRSYSLKVLKNTIVPGPHKFSLRATIDHDIITMYLEEGMGI